LRIKFARKNASKKKYTEEIEDLANQFCDRPKIAKDDININP